MDAPQKSFRLSKLTIRNFRAIDHLELEFPPPVLPDDPDIFVIGSRNGVGKTSILQAAALTLLAGMHREAQRVVDLDEVDADLKKCIRAGADQADLAAKFRDQSGQATARSALRIDRSSRTDVMREGQWRQVLPPAEVRWGTADAPDPHVLRLFPTVFEAASSPFALRPLVYFNSYRRVAVDNPTVGQLAESQGNKPGGRASAVDLFKRTAISAIMQAKGAVEVAEGLAEPTEALSFLARLVEDYAGLGLSDRLGTDRDGLLELRVKPAGSGDGFAFDSLSSGQKEIIATLFLVWVHSRQGPCMVLIDEPELHLNAEWHRKLIWKLHDVAPWNQYIVATHSAHVFGAVEESRRILIEAESGAHA